MLIGRTRRERAQLNARTSAPLLTTDDRRAADLCAACAAREVSQDEWRVLEPEDPVLAVAGVLASAAAERPGERVYVQAALEVRTILADSVDVHQAVSKLRRRYGWVVDAAEGQPGYRLERWPFRFRRSRG